jgi:hypothetical protein
VLAGSLCGYPNGRRLGQDVIDVDPRAVFQRYGSFSNGLLGLPNKSPNNLVGVSVDANDVPFLTTSPDVASPHQGYEVALIRRKAGWAERRSAPFRPPVPGRKP